MTDAEFAVLFSNVEQLLAANQVLLGKLNARKEQNVFLPEICKGFNLSCTIVTEIKFTMTPHDSGSGRRMC